MILQVFIPFSPPGSATLHHWQQLAQPHLGVILDARPGVVPKGYRPLELELEQVCVLMCLCASFQYLHYGPTQSNAYKSCI